MATATAPPVARRSALDTARDALEAAKGDLDAILEGNRALMSKRSQLGQTLTREGKLTRAQRSELASVNRQLKAHKAPLAKAMRAFNRAQERFDREDVRQRAREDRERVKRETAARAKVARKVEQIEARSRKRACFAMLPLGAKPSKGTRKPDSGHAVLEHGYVTREGRGAKARWVLVVTDSYQLSVLPLDVSDERAVRECFIPAQALKDVEKAGAFRVTKNGGIQPLKVTASSSYGTEDVVIDGQRGYPRVWTATKVGTGYLLPDAPGRFPDYSQLVAKPPAKVNSYRVRLDPELLKRTAEAIGAGNSVTLTFDLSKAGKAAQGRRCTGAFLVTNGTDAVATMMPVRADA